MIGSKITHDGPGTGLFLYWIGRLWMWFFGWDVIGQFPPGGKCILIAAPHTSNWDLAFLLIASFVFRIKMSWLGKEAIFKKPFGGIMRWLGGISVDRSSQHGLVDQMVDHFSKSEKLTVAVPASGTRKKKEYWKSGFYWIAHQAQVPIVCGYLDYSRKVACIGISIIPTGNVKSDMDRIREFYKDVKAKYPEMKSRIRLTDEDDPISETK